MKLSKLIEEFIVYLESVLNYSPQTIKNYRSDLKIFASYCTTQFKINYINQITDLHIIKFIGFTKNTLNNSAYASARKLRCLRSLFRYAVERHYLESSPTESIREPKIEKRLPIYLTLDEAQHLLARRPQVVR